MKSHKNLQHIIFWISLAVIILLGSFLRFYQIGEQSFWLDEAISFSTISDGFTTFIRTGNMALFYLLAALWTRLLPVITEASLRSLTAIFSILSIPLIFLSGKSVFEDERKGLLCGLIAAFLLAINSTEVRYAQEFRSYSLTTLLTLASTLLLIQLVKERAQKTWTLVLYTLITTAAAYSHLFAGLLIASHVISLFFLMTEFKNNKRFLRQMLICYLSIVLLLLPLAILVLIVRGDQLSMLTLPKFGNIPSLFMFLIGEKSYFSLVLYITFSVISLVWGHIHLDKQNHSPKWTMSLLVINLLFPIVAIFVLSYIVQPLFFNRYLLLVNPYLILLTSAGIVLTADYLKKVFPKALPELAMIGLLLLPFMFFSYSGLVNYYGNPKKEDWRTASKILSEQCSSNLILYYPTWLNTAVEFYSPSLSNPSKDIVNQILLTGTHPILEPNVINDSNYRVCLVLSHINDPTRADNGEKIISAIEQAYSNSSIFEPYGVNIYVFWR